jgi:hypothetical protein
MLIQKTNPIGIDKVIDDIQLRLESENSLPYCVFYPRIYKNPNKDNRKKTKIPEVSISVFDYEEVLMNDLKHNQDVFLTAFFNVSDSREMISTGKFKTEISVIFQCSDLSKLLPSLSFRSDEELLNHFVAILYNWRNDIKLKSIETGVENVYKEFAQDKIRLTDMSERFVFRLNLDVNYQTCFCENC